MKYIDADKLREAVEGTTWYHIFNGRLVEGANSEEHEPLYKASAIYKVLDNADVVEVVRCRECVMWDGSFTLNGQKKCLNMTFCTDGDFYCGWGSKE